MRIAWFALVALAGATLGIIGDGLLGAPLVWRGTPEPLTGERLHRGVFDQCRLGSVDPATLKLGPLIRDLDGQYLAVGLTPEGRLVECSVSGVHAISQVEPGRTPEVKVQPVLGSDVRGRPGMILFGHAAPGIERVEAVLPGEQVVRAELVNGAFAAVAPTLEVGQFRLVRFRGFDGAGKLVYEFAR